jgi:hypothetical protein
MKFCLSNIKNNRNLGILKWTVESDLPLSIPNDMVFSLLEVIKKGSFIDIEI